MNPMIKAWQLFIKEYFAPKAYYLLIVTQKQAIYEDKWAPEFESYTGYLISSVHTEPLHPHALQAAGCRLSYLLHSTTVKIFVIKTNRKADV